MSEVFEKIISLQTVNQIILEDSKQLKFSKVGFQMIQSHIF